MDLENFSEKPKAKRGRRSKKDIALALEKEKNEENNVVVNNNASGVVVNVESSNNVAIVQENEKPLPKKRGRKPKGGKIVQQNSATFSAIKEKPNIVLHLKCFMKDIKNDNMNGSSNNDGSDLESYQFISTKNELNYEIIQNSHDVLNENAPNAPNTPNTLYQIIEAPQHLTYSPENNIANEYDDNNYETKDIWRKLKILEHNLHINNISDKKSACFWCSYDFDNPPIYIPKHFIQNSYQVYGCFCSPECATAYLMEENIDSSTKFERYHLMNHIYSKIFVNKKNIKPAPNPHYMLERYYGNLTIQEYRSLLKSERLFLVVDKPLTRVLPEFHEDNDEFIINSKIIPSNNYQLKKKLQKKIPTKNNIVNEKFGVAN